MIAISNGNHGVRWKFFFGGNKASASALFVWIVRLVIEGGHVLILYGLGLGVSIVRACTL